MEHLRERSRSERDGELKRKGKLKEERKVLTTRDKRVQAVFQRLDSEIRRVSGTSPPGCYLVCVR